MKIVKLNKTHRLYHEGYTHAFRFNGMFSINAMQVRKAMSELYGQDRNKWTTWACRKRHPYWIAVSEEKYLTFAILKIDMT